MDEYRNCLGCGSRELVIVLDMMGGYCSSQCEREHKEVDDG